MFIVKKRSELIRFGLFLLAVGLMAFYVAGRFAAWRSAMASAESSNSPAVSSVRPVAASQGQPVAASPILSGPQQGADLLDRAQAASDGSDFFAEFRMERDRSRAALKSTLQEVMAAAQTDAAIRGRATEQYMAVSRISALEEQAEAMIRARGGFADVLVYLSDSAAQVVVKQKDMNQAQVMQVVDMVAKVTGVKPASVVVIPREQ